MHLTKQSSNAGDGIVKKLSPAFCDRICKNPKRPPAVFLNLFGQLYSALFEKGRGLAATLRKPPCEHTGGFVWLYIATEGEVSFGARKAERNRYAEL